MSDAQPLWDDQRIEKAAFELSERIRVQAYGGGEREIKVALTEMRAEYEAKLADSQPATQQQPVYEHVTKIHCACGEPDCDKYVRLEYGEDGEPSTLWFATHDGFEDMVYLSSDVGLYRLVQQQPQEPTQ